MIKKLHNIACMLALAAGIGFCGLAAPAKAADALGNAPIAPSSPPVAPSEPNIVILPQSPIDPSEELDMPAQTSPENLPDIVLPTLEPNQEKPQKEEDILPEEKDLQSPQIEPTPEQELAPLVPVQPDESEEAKIETPTPSTVIVPTPQTSPEQQSQAPQAPTIYFTPADFLLREKDVPVVPKEPEPEQPQPEQPEPEEPESEEDPTPSLTPETKQKPKKEQKPPTPPRKEEEPKNTSKGDPFRVPEEAKETKDLSFLEGCWKGYRPEYMTKRMITERFCFDAAGNGKRSIIDMGYAGTCTGATKALINEDGVLKMQSEQAYCSSGVKWESSTMTCQGEGPSTPCTWIFNDPQHQQSYSINFVRD